MALDLYDKSEKYIIDMFMEKKEYGRIRHFERTVYWLKVLRPDADEALQIAAIAHDVERHFMDPDVYGEVSKSEKGYADEQFLKHHQEEGARIIGEYLATQGADQKIIERVKMLVSKHEVGGTDDQNLLKDADSLSFLENNTEHFIGDHSKKTSKDKVREKFDWTFNRITSEKAKEIARPWYEEAVKKLEDS